MCSKFMKIYVVNYPQNYLKTAYAINALKVHLCKSASRHQYNFLQFSETEVSRSQISVTNFIYNNHWTEKCILLLEQLLKWGGGGQGLYCADENFNICNYNNSYTLELL